MPRNHLVLSALVVSCALSEAPSLVFGRGGPGVRVGVSVGGPAVRGGVVVGGGRGYYGRPYGGPYYRPYPRYGWGAPYAFGVGVGVGAAYAYPGYGYAPYYAYPPAYAYPAYPAAVYPAAAYPAPVGAPIPAYDPSTDPGARAVPPPSGAGVPTFAPPNAAMKIPEPGAFTPNQADLSAAQPVPTPAMLANAKTFVTQGDQAFRKGDYNAALYAWKHAVVDNPQDATVTMKLAQALFAIGQFEEAAGATQGAMQQLPKESWGNTIRGYRNLYGNQQDYTKQLRVLEKAVQEKPDNPAVHFLAGFHYAYLGFTKQSIEQLDLVLKLVPNDEFSSQLKAELQGSSGNKSAEPNEAIPVNPVKIPTGKEGPALPGVSE